MLFRSNYIAGAPYFRAGFDTNGSFDPRVYTASAPAASSVLAGGVQPDGSCNVAQCAWTNPAAGEWGTTAPYLNGFRWRRKPSEAFNIGRNFRMGHEGKVVLNIRAEFQNIFNRTFLSVPSTANPNIAISTTTYNGQVINNAGFGSVATLNGAGATPRTGQIVARFTF